MQLFRHGSKGNWKSRDQAVYFLTATGSVVVKIAEWSQREGKLVHFFSCPKWLIVRSGRF